MKRRTHYLLFLCTLALACVSIALIFRVNVNNDMTKYLPSDSQMTIGIDAMENEYGKMSQFGTNVHVMFDDLPPGLVPGTKLLLSGYPNVYGVTYRYNEDSTKIVFDLDVPNEVNQKSLGGQIRSQFGGNCVVETSQDGATPPMMVIIIAAIMIMAVLIVMAQSWFEPFVILITAGIAIVLNVGTNAFLGSVSMTTNFISPILQAVLSLDYCIVLLNRYRQEQNDRMDRESAALAANNAVKRAMPAILSSAFTTVVGLLMLCFMRLRIGEDMGIVLAKGVVFSLICTFTVMPSLMMLFRRTINKTAKPAYVPPTNRFARFVAAHKLPMAVTAVLLAVCAWFYSQRTTIFFSEKAESKIEEYFPSPNPFVVLYRTEDEGAIFNLANDVWHDSTVVSVISYPTLMTQQMTPAQMASHARVVCTDFKDMLPENVVIPTEVVDLISPDMMEILYYLRSKEEGEQRMNFPDLARFLHSHIITNPMIAQYLDDDMVNQIEMLQSMLEVPEPEPEPQPVDTIPAVQPEEEPEDTVTLPRETIAPLTIEPATLVVNDSLAIPQMEIEKIAIVPFFERLKTAKPSAVAVELHKLTDTIALRLPLNINQMSLYMGSTITQTRFVYNYAPAGTKELTPLQYVHLLKDDLFRRKGLAGMVSEEQKKQLSQRAHIMDLANENASLTPEELNILLRSFDIFDLTEEELLTIANPPVKAEPIIAETAEQVNKVEIVNNIAEVQKGLFNTDTTRAVVAVSEKQEEKKPRKRVTNEDLKAALFTELAFGGKTYTPAQMSGKLNRLMKLSEVYAAPVTPAQMSLLYDYYYSTQSNCDTMRMGFESLLIYMSDTLAYDERLVQLFPIEMLEQIRGAKVLLKDGLGQLRKDNYSLFVVLSTLPAESPATYAFVDTLFAAADRHLPNEHYLIGRSVMYHEMKNGFGAETRKVSLLTILAIFLIVAATFRSVIVPLILVVAVMTAVYANVVVAGLLSGQMLYLAYLIVQAILMGASIDYGILFANYYRENRKTMVPVDAVCAAYRGSIRTILTSGLIMMIGPGVMALTVGDVMIRNIVGSLAVGTFMAVLMTLTVVPAVLVALDKWVVYGKKNRFGAELMKKKQKNDE